MWRETEVEAEKNPCRSLGVSIPVTGKFSLQELSILLPVYSNPKLSDSNGGSRGNDLSASAHGQPDRVVSIVGTGFTSAPFGCRNPEITETKTRISAQRERLVRSSTYSWDSGFEASVDLSFSARTPGRGLAFHV